MAELFIEIFSEEIPARMQERAGADLAKALSDGLTKAGLSVDGAQSLTGPRRLVFTADVPLRSPDISEERKGPRVGAPERALEGFMKAAGLSDISQAETHEDKKGAFYIAKIEKPGLPSAEIVAGLLPEIMNNFPWPKSMKSGGASFRWVRPLQGIICLLDGDVINIEIGGIKSGRNTEGHRRLGLGPYSVKNFADYKAQLEGSHDLGGHVMLDAAARKDKILADAKAVCAAKGLELAEDIGLLNEVAGLAEWPVVLLGDMDERFLELPAEVIRLTLKSHQKTFTVRDPKTGKLAPHYIIIANQIAPDGGEAIKAGNGKVISARLSDARFFQDEDRKHSLESYYDKLGTVVFHKKLGSIKDKAERVAALARELAPKVGANPDVAETAARLAKCDLVTQTVIEFTSLEGQIGGMMYRHEGGDADIALAIEQHYKPKGPSDAVPSNPVAVAVALADKLDSLVGFWAIDEKPTGSKDPFALRRAALGVVRIILENEVRFKLSKQIKFSIFQLRKQQLYKEVRQNLFVPCEVPEGNIWKNSTAAKVELENTVFAKFPIVWPNEVGQCFEDIDYLAQSFSEIATDFPSNRPIPLKKATLRIVGEDGEFLTIDDPDDLITSAVTISTKSISAFDEIANLLAFIFDRLKVYLRDKGIRHDIIDAVLGNGEDDLVAIVNRVEALQAFLSTDDGENLMAGYKRAANILKAEAKKAKGEPLPTGAPDKPAQAEAVALYDALNSVKPAIESALADENYALAMQELSKLRAPIDGFFDHVTVIDDDTAVMKNNLRLLLLIRDTARQIADFEAIQG